MTDLKDSHTTRAVRDAVVAWLDTDPTMAPLGQGADARALEAAHDRLLPVLAAALHVARATPSLGVSGPQYTYTGCNVLQASHDELQRRLAERDAYVLALCDHLSRETKSAEAASAIADELSVALEKSRERVAELEADVRALKTLRDEDQRIGVSIVEGYEEQLAALRDRMADPEGMAHALPQPTRAEQGFDE